MCEHMLHKLNSTSNIAGVNDMTEMSGYIKDRGK